MWDEVPVEDAIRQVQQLLRLTQTDKLEWRRSDEAGLFIATSPSGKTAAIDLVTGPTRRERFVRLRFSRRGETDFSTVIQQLTSGGDPMPGESERDAFLALLHQRVLERAGHQPTAAEEFLEDFE